LEHDGPSHADLIFLKVDIVPLETKELTHPQPGPESQQHKSAFSNAKNRKKPLDFVCTEYHRGRPAFRTLPDEPNRISIADFVSHAVIEKHAHEISDFRAARPRKGQGSQPKLNLPSVDADKWIFSPTG
jgi:hypothetical protein